MTSKLANWVQPLKNHLRVPLYLNAYALTLSTFLTSGLGMLYWIIAARYYSTEDVGVNSAAISAMYLIANISQLNLTSFLNRFLPNAGKRSTRFILISYFLSSAVSVVGTLIFIAGIQTWSPELNLFVDTPQTAFYFVVAIVLWGIFVLQDSAFVGMRQAIWVPIENLIFAILKIVLLVVAAFLLPVTGIFVSWTLAVAFIIIPVNLLIFRRLLPRHIETSKANEQEKAEMRGVMRFIAGDYLGYLAHTALHSFMPLLVLSRLGSSASAYFYLVLTVVYSVYLISQNMGMSLTTEAALSPERLYRYAYQVLVQTYRLQIPLVLVVVVGAPYILVLFGSDYATGGTDVLRLLALSAIPDTIISLYIGIARVRNQTSRIFAALTVQTFLILLGSSLTMDEHGIVAIGYVWLAATTVIALVLLVDIRQVWSARHLKDNA